MALAKPGTVTLEVALLGTPLVVTTRVNRFTAWLMRRLVRVSSYTMPNLIAGRTVVPEFLQEDADPAQIAEALLGLLAGPARETQLAALAAVREQLGAGGAAQRAAAHRRGDDAWGRSAIAWRRSRPCSARRCWLPALSRGPAGEPGSASGSARIRPPRARRRRSGCTAHRWARSAPHCPCSTRSPRAGTRWWLRR